MMGRILGQHPKVHTFGELHFFEELVEPSTANAKVPHSEAVSIVATLLSIARDGYLARRRPDLHRQDAEKILCGDRGDISPFRAYELFLQDVARENGAVIPCEQTPRNLLFVDEILSRWPNATIVEMVRDPRDVLLSQKRRGRRGFLSKNGHSLVGALRSWANYHPVVTSRIWRNSIRCGNRYSGDERVIRIRFEDLVQDPESAIRNLCATIGIEYECRMLDVPKVGSSSGLERDET